MLLIEGRIVFIVMIVSFVRNVVIDFIDRLSLFVVMMNVMFIVIMLIKVEWVRILVILFGVRKDEFSNVFRMISVISVMMGLSVCKFRCFMWFFC